MPEIWRESIDDRLTAVVSADGGRKTATLYVFDADGVKLHERPVLIDTSGALDLSDHFAIWHDIAIATAGAPPKSPPSEASRYATVAAAAVFVAASLALILARALRLGPATEEILIGVVALGVLGVCGGQFLDAVRRRSRSHEVLWVAVGCVSLLSLGIAFDPDLGGEIGQPSPVAWSTDLSRATHYAAELNRPLIAFFYQPNCAYCAYLDQDSEDKHALEEISICCVFVKINAMQDSPAIRRLLQVSKLSKVPTIVAYAATKDGLIDSGQIVGYQKGLVFSDGLAAIVDQAKMTSAIRKLHPR